MWLLQEGSAHYHRRRRFDQVALQVPQLRRHALLHNLLEESLPLYL